MIKVAHLYRTLGFLLLVMEVSFAQLDFPVTTSALQKINPSIHGMNLSSKAGHLFSNFNYGDGLSSENNYMYGNIAFQNLNFSIGVDVNSFSLNQLGLKKNDIKLTYVYKLQLGFESYFLGGLDLGIASQTVDPRALIFQDQLNLQLGTVLSSSIDPLARIKPSTNYFDVGVSGLIYTEKFLVGVHLGHINTPNVSFNKESEFKKDMSFSALGAFEFEVNPYGRGILPENTCFFGTVYGISQGESLRVVSTQELQLSNFSVGLMQSLIRFNESSSTELGLLTSLSFDKFLFNLSYSFNSDTTSYNTPSIFEIGLRFSFDRFSQNRRGVYKRLNIYNL